MKILQISNYYKPHIGGIEQTSHDISDSLKKMNDIMVLCFSEDKKDKDENIDGVRVIKCGVNVKVSSQAISTSYGKKLKMVLNEFKPDIVIFHFPNPFVSHYLLKYKKRNFKLVVWFHADIVNQKILGKFFVNQTNKLLKRANSIICTSPNYRDESKTLQNFKNKVQVIPSCINEKRLVKTKSTNKKAIEIKNTYSNKTIVFAIGRHVKYKGLTYLVEAAKHLDDSYQVLIAGSGPLTNELKEQAKGLNNVQFLGRISDEDIVSYLSAADIYTFPSITKNEAFGISLAEAMYFGLPCVTFKIPGSGVNYVSLNNVTGIEVENSNAEAFAMAIKKLAGDKVLANEFGTNAKKRVNDLFTFTIFSQRINKLLEDLENDSKE